VIETFNAAFCWIHCSPFDINETLRIESYYIKYLSTYLLNYYTLFDAPPLSYPSVFTHAISPTLLFDFTSICYLHISVKLLTFYNVCCRWLRAINNIINKAYLLRFNKTTPDHFTILSSPWNLQKCPLIHAAWLMLIFEFHFYCLQLCAYGGKNLAIFYYYFVTKATRLWENRYEPISCKRELVETRTHIYDKIQIILWTNNYYTSYLL